MYDCHPETSSAKMAADFAVCVSFRDDKPKTKQLRFYFKHSFKRSVSFIYLFQQRNYLCNNSKFSCRIYAFVAKHEDIVFLSLYIVIVGLSGGRFSDEKGCCLSSKTREKNVCRGKMIELSTQIARVAEVCGMKSNLVPRAREKTLGTRNWNEVGMKREIDRKCLIHVRGHANAQSFDRCGLWDSNVDKLPLTLPLM